MMLPKSSDAPHKVQMYRLLTAILKDTELANVLVFKGGTCAVLRGWLDRFSVDLDFDLIDKDQIAHLRDRLHRHFETLQFVIKDESKHHLQFFLKYEAPQLNRNTLKLEINDDVSPYNKSEMSVLGELNMMAQTQTQSTMVTCKMVAALGRYKQHHTVAGRDFYDLHHFLSHGYEVDSAIVEERTGQSFQTYTYELIDFITTHVSDEVLYEDLNPLIEASSLKNAIRNVRGELVWLLENRLG